MFIEKVESITAPAASALLESLITGAKFIDNLVAVEIRIAAGDTIFWNIGAPATLTNNPLTAIDRFDLKLDIAKTIEIIGTAGTEKISIIQYGA